MKHWRRDDVSPFLIAAAVIAALFVTPVQAQNRCAATVNIISHLQDKYAESVRYQGVNSKGNLVLIMASENGSWSLLELPAKGAGRIACLQFGGDRISDTGSILTMTYQDSTAEIRVAQDGSWTLVINGTFVGNGDGWRRVSPVKPAGFKI